MASTLRAYQKAAGCSDHRPPAAALGTGAGLQDPPPYQRALCRLSEEKSEKGILTETTESSFGNESFQVCGLKNALSSDTQDGSKLQCLHLALEDAGRAGKAHGHDQRVPNVHSHP